MKCIAGILIWSLAAHFVLSANLDGPAPTLGVIFPAQESDSLIFTTSHLWLSPGNVLPEGVQIVNIFMMPRSTDSDVQKAKARNRFAQATAEKRGVKSTETAEQTALRSRVERGTLKNINHLRGILQAADRMREEVFIVYKSSGDKNTTQVPLAPPYGALFAQKGSQAPTLIWLRAASQAESKALQLGDKLTAVNGKKITSLAQADVAWRSRLSDRLTLEVSRNGRMISVDFGPAVNLMQSAVDSW